MSLAGRRAPSSAERLKHPRRHGPLEVCAPAGGTVAPPTALPVTAAAGEQVSAGVMLQSSSGTHSPLHSRTAACRGGRQEQIAIQLRQPLHRPACSRRRSRGLLLARANRVRVSDRCCKHNARRGRRDTYSVSTACRFSGRDLRSPMHPGCKETEMQEADTGPTLHCTQGT